MHFFSILFFMILMASSSCSKTVSSIPAPSQSLPFYKGFDTLLFDDSIDPLAVDIKAGVALNPLQTQAIFRERAQLASTIVKVKVTMLTSRGKGNTLMYQLVLKPVDRIAGFPIAMNAFIFNIDRKNNGFGIVDSLQGRLVGKTFIAFIRNYRKLDNSKEFHFYLGADHPSTLKKISSLRDNIEGDN
ncbi:hypothetical protein [Pajaroellobacter abortibovis]|uniref:Uncharacterized protein n=1 Tax=Pajaroellobacter abortibovis TaxID=1882918 RepID=A0A1L6MXC1_9BACT|nr:hypothetical protein [Pajaroellobacter abortibovis]APS00038.1 hypothetical protein BCY86_04580 [Pajaroellobacter abortibovis]